jgi:bacterial leucyl aminopeptidase
MKTRNRIILLALWFTLVALACTLTSEPPTVAPRATDTPPAMATLGFATLSPEEMPQQQPTQVASFDGEMFNLYNQVQSDRLLYHIDTMQNFHTRHILSSFEHPDQGIGAAYRYIKGQFENIQAQSQGRLFVFTHDFPVAWNGINTTGRNVVAVIQGTEVGAGVILISAHYDSRALNLDDYTGYAPGANDNASGVAAMIEIARILSARQQRATIMFVAFSAEEIGRIGSIAFVTDYIQRENIPLTAVINLDIIGSETGPDGSINYSQIDLFSAGPDDSSSRRLAREVNFLAFNSPLDMEIVVRDREDRAGAYGDHSSFSNRGYAAVRFTETNEELQRRHTERDTIHDIQARYMSRATQTVLTVVTSLAGGPRPPRNLSLRDQGNGVRTLVWEPVDGATSYVVALRRPGSLIYDQQFEWPTNSVDWDGFSPDRYAAVAVSARDGSGLLGPLSDEYALNR